MRVVTEETDWIGGQLTAQAVPPDEHAWIESYGSHGAIAHIEMPFAIITGNICR